MELIVHNKILQRLFFRSFLLIIFVTVNVFRSMYPGGQGQYSKMSGIGLLRLHSTYRHDLKIYASDEGRVQMTAAAFAKVFRLMPIKMS